MSPIVIPVKKDESIKLGLESRKLNEQVHRNKYQRPFIDDLVGGISQIIAERKAGDFFFTTLDFTYAYGQAALDKKPVNSAIFHY